MDPKLEKKLSKFLKEMGDKDEKELNEALQEFIKSYEDNSYEKTPLEEAYDFLEKAENASSKKEALRLAKLAYKTSPACLDAILLQVELEQNSIKRMQLLKKGLKAEEERLKKEGFFEDDSIGIFYGILETRPYMRGLHAKAMDFLSTGKMKLAMETCQEMLRLNQNDNLGARYLLMAIYAYLEEEKPMLALYKTYKENSFEMLFPFLALYYKQENEKKAKAYLEKVNQANPFFVKAFKGTLKKDKDILEGYYRRGKSSEILMYFEQYSFLMESIPFLEDFVLANTQ